MTKADIRDTLRHHVRPVLLGNTAEAHRLASRLFRRFGVISLICGKPRLRDLFDAASQTLRLPQNACERLCVEALLELARANDELILLLIPCSDEAKEITRRNKIALERCYMLSDADTLFTSSVLADTEQRLRARKPHSVT